MSHDKGILIKQKKIICNKKHNSYLEVAIGEIRKIDNIVEPCFVISFGGGKEAIFIGREEWNKFIELVNNLDWNPEDTWIRPLKDHKKNTCQFD